MTSEPIFEIFMAAAPGLEATLAEEVRHKGFRQPKAVPGGIVTRGGWPEVWRANLWIRGTGRVLARIASFRAVHLAQLDTLARRVPWNSVLRPDVPFRVEASCAASRIYHSGAAAQRIATAIRDQTSVDLVFRIAIRANQPHRPAPLPNLLNRPRICPRGLCAVPAFRHV